MSSSVSIATPSRPDLAERARVVGVVAHQRGHVKRRREARLAVLEQVVEALVGLLARAEAGELAHRPQPPAVHRLVDAARERVGARAPDRVLGPADRPPGRSSAVYSSRTGSPESVRKAGSVASAGGFGLTAMRRSILVGPRTAPSTGCSLSSADGRGADAGARAGWSAPSTCSRRRPARPTTTTARAGAAWTAAPTRWCCRAAPQEVAAVVALVLRARRADRPPRRRHRADGRRGAR